MDSPNPLVYRTLAIATVRGAPDADHVEILGLPSARIFRLNRDRPDFPELLDRLRTAAASGRPVQLGFIDERIDVIEDVVA